MDYLLVGIGGVFGSLSRYYLGKYIASKSNTDFPWGTFTINVTGTFILSLLTFYPALESSNYYSQTRFLVMVGFLGAYTTFSTWSYETYQLIKNQDYFNLSMYVGGTLLIGFMAVYVGMLIGKII